MSKDNFRVSLDALTTLETIKNAQDSELVHEEIVDVGNGKMVATLIFEKYFMRAKNRAALIVTLDNIENHTDLRVISTGSSQGMFLNFDWGAADSFVSSVRRSLKEYILE
ncbi:MAG: hypothetical protein GX947_09315 [Tissierellia bacterium]|nr:hypothetical protein [Tissierellia bacterium]